MTFGVVFRRREGTAVEFVYFPRLLYPRLWTWMSWQTSTLDIREHDFKDYCVWIRHERGLGGM